MKFDAAPSPSHRYEIGWLRKNSSSSRPISTLAMHSAMIPTLTTYLSGFRPIGVDDRRDHEERERPHDLPFADGVASNTAASHTEPK